MANKGVVITSACNIDCQSVELLCYSGLDAEAKQSGSGVGSRLGSRDEEDGLQIIMAFVYTQIILFHQWPCTGLSRVARDNHIERQRKKNKKQIHVL